MSQAQSGYGVTLQHNASGSYASVAEIVSFDGPGPELQTIDVSNLTSPSDIEEVIAGQIKNGELSGKGNFLESDATQRAMIAAIYTRTTLSFKINWQGGTVWTFTAFVTRLRPTGVAVNSKIEMAFTLKPTGRMTIPT